MRTGPAELCNDIDDDCDGTVDEGARNACGACGPPAVEACDGVDADCDGAVDEDAPCAAGQICLEGRCRQPRSEAGGPCRVDDDCAAGVCNDEPIFPGGWCQVDCARDVDCGAAAACLDVGVLACLERCDAAADCRPGWVCYADDGICFPSCQNIGCAAGYLCGADGFCAIPVLNITVTQVFLSPGVSDGSAWDGFGNVGQADFAAAAQAALSGNLASLTAVAAQFANAAYAPPDPFGTATLLQGPISRSLNLAEIQDTYSPQWAGISWRVALDPAADTRVRISLTDADLANDDPIGTVEVGQADLIAAQAAGRVFPVATVNQGNGHIIAVAISVRAE
ncbi:MAG: MopE-related protein [bacterium]